MATYKYRREDFGDLPVRLEHLTIHLNFLEETVEATIRIDMTALEPLKELALDANDLEILRVVWSRGGSDAPPQATRFRYDQEVNRLVVPLSPNVDRGERFTVTTVTRCRPSDNILEGIYKDVTPPGAPQQYISQCQQWGFQRIMPIIDDCRAKCTMTVTLEADGRYTHLISNGNISRETNPDGVPVPVPGNPTRQTITYETTVPMAPYLFIAAVGTWDELVDYVTYPSDRTIRLEYLVPPGRAEGARIPMEILKEAILWVGRTQDYEYTGDTYRTICMTKSNFGGMENVGNTTIVTDAALIDEYTLDHALIYAHAVIVHEYEHNQCGSETTMETPFDVWLNEAYTVHVERQFLAGIFDPTFMRINQVDSIRNPLLGPLAIEDSGRGGQIVREGFNNPDELIDGVTYVKAAEVIRMMQLFLGLEVFRAGKTLYFSRYHNGNANTDQFFACFEEVSGRSLDSFKKAWLYTRGYPNVSARCEYQSDRGEFRIHFRQEPPECRVAFPIPLQVALVDRNGATVPGTEKVFELASEQAVLTFTDIGEAPAFASVNRDYSFYGTLTQEDADSETLALQARLDPNLFNRVEAVARLTDRERVRLLLNPGAEISRDWLDVYGSIVGDRGIPHALKAYFLRIEEQPLDRRYSTWFPEQVAARERLMLAANQAYRDLLVEEFAAIDTYRPRRSAKDGIEDRMLKNQLLALIAVDDSPESHRMIVEHCERSLTPADRVAPLTLLNRSTFADRREVLEIVYDAWHEHTGGYPNYLRVVALGAGEDFFDAIEREKTRPTFDVNRPSLSRALFVTAGANTKMIWTDDGIEWVARTVIWLASINDYVASRLLNTFQHFGNLKPDLREKVRPWLERVAVEVSERVSPTVQGQARAYLGQ